MTVRDVEVMEVWLNSDSYADAARKIGVTSRQRVEQCVRATGPRWLVSLHLQRCRARRHLKAHEADRSIPPTMRDCRVCGHAFLTPPNDFRITCSADHAEAWVRLRNHIGIHRTQQRELTVRYWLRESNDPVRIRHAEKYLAGEAGYRGRWLLEGSEAWKWALEARRQGWPILKELPMPIRRQVAKASLIPDYPLW